MEPERHGVYRDREDQGNNKGDEGNDGDERGERQDRNEDNSEEGSQNSRARSRPDGSNTSSPGEGGSRARDEQGGPIGPTGGSVGNSLAGHKRQKALRNEAQAFSKKLKLRNMRMIEEVLEIMNASKQQRNDFICDARSTGLRTKFVLRLTQLLGAPIEGQLIGRITNIIQVAVSIGGPAAMNSLMSFVKEWRKEHRAPRGALQAQRRRSPSPPVQLSQISVTAEPESDELADAFKAMRARYATMVRRETSSAWRAVETRIVYASVGKYYEQVERLLDDDPEACEALIRAHGFAHRRQYHDTDVVVMLLLHGDPVVTRRAMNGRPGWSDSPTAMEYWTALVDEPPDAPATLPKVTARLALALRWRTIQQSLGDCSVLFFPPRRRGSCDTLVARMSDTDFGYLMELLVNSHPIARHWMGPESERLRTFLKHLLVNDPPPRGWVLSLEAMNGNDLEDTWDGVEDKDDHPEAVRIRIGMLEVNHNMMLPDSAGQTSMFEYLR